MAAAGRILFVGGILNVLNFVGLDQFVTHHEIEAIRTRRAYKQYVDLTGDGKKDIKYENGAVFVQDSAGKFEKVIPYKHDGADGYISMDRNKFYDTKGNQIDLRKRRRYSEDSGQVMLT